MTGAETLPLIELKPDWTYCGGLKVKGNKKVIFLPGVHVFKDGPFIVDDNATIEGLGGVGLYFTGKNAYFEFKKNAKVDLQAPSSGPMAGLLVFQDRTAAHQNFKITSDFTRNLIGTIYLPKDLRATSFGVNGDPVPATFLRQLTYPLRRPGAGAAASM